MRTKINFRCIGIMLLCIAVLKNSIAQPIPAQKGNRQSGSDFTFKVFQAPNKMFGYDIYQEGKGIFHQPAALVLPINIVANQQSANKNLPVANNRQAEPNGFTTKEVAENAALLSIEKIKKRSIPLLTSDEVKQVNTATNKAKSIKN